MDKGIKILKALGLGILLMSVIVIHIGITGCKNNGDNKTIKETYKEDKANNRHINSIQADEKGIKETDFTLGKDDIELVNREPITDIQLFSGAQITVAAPSGRMADFIHKNGQEWAKRVGAKLDVLEIPFSKIFEEVATDILRNKGTFDIILYPHYLSGDIMGTGKLIPLENLIDVDKANNSYREGGLEWDSYFRPYREIYSWYNNHLYSLPVDGDVFQVAYRKDLWLKYGSEFYSNYNYKLRPDDPSFPETWEQYYDIAEFFNGKEGHYGTIDINARSRASAWHFLTRYVSYLKKEGMYNGDVYFDKETMEPLINNPAGVKAMEDVINSINSRYTHKDVVNSGWDDMQREWHQGNTVIQFTWPAMANIARRPGTTIPEGIASTGYSLIPGSLEVYDVDDNKWITLDEPNRASILAHGWQFSIVDTCTDQEAAFDFMRWMTTGDRLIHNTQKLYWEYEPIKEWQLEDRDIKEQFKDAPSYLKSLELSHQVGIPDLRIPGAVQMYDAIEIYKVQALQGKITAEEAVDAIASDWTKIIRQRGYESMKKAYIDTITPRELSHTK